MKQPEQADQAQPDYYDAEYAPEPQGIEPITWTASEFVAHEKSAGWYGILAVAAAAVAGLIYLILRDWITSGMVVIGAILFGIVAARKPNQQQYSMDAAGLQIGAKHYDFEAFRSFAVVDEGAFSSIIFMPLKRFAPLTTIYFAPEDEPRIVQVVSARLPVEDYQHDLVDRVLRHIRF